jgi:hypothetical protein
MGKYSEFTTDIDNYLGTFTEEKHPDRYFGKLLLEKGFKILHIETTDHMIDFETETNFTGEILLKLAHRFAVLIVFYLFRQHESHWLIRRKNAARSSERILCRLDCTL